MLKRQGAIHSQIQRSRAGFVVWLKAFSQIQWCILPYEKGRRTLLVAPTRLRWPQYTIRENAIAPAGEFFGRE
jgi:hypothetical protein